MWNGMPHRVCDKTCSHHRCMVGHGGRTKSWAAQAMKPRSGDSKIPSPSHHDSWDPPLSLVCADVLDVAL